jgi:hypothetical protein
VALICTKLRSAKPKRPFGGECISFTYSYLIIRVLIRYLRLEHIAKMKKKQAKVVNKSKRKAHSTIHHAQKPFKRHSKGQKNSEITEKSQDGSGGPASLHSQSRTGSVGRSGGGHGVSDSSPIEHNLNDEHTDFPAHAPGSPTAL